MSFSQHWHHHVLQELFDTPAPKVEWKWNSGYAAWEAMVEIGDTAYGLMMSSFPWEQGGMGAGVLSFTNNDLMDLNIMM